MAKEKDYIQRTLVVLKPDTVQRGIIGEIIQRFERVGLKIVGMKMVMPEEKLYRAVDAEAEARRFGDGDLRLHLERSPLRARRSFGRLLPG